MATKRPETLTCYLGPSRLCYLGPSQLCYLGHSQLCYFGHSQLCYLGPCQQGRKNSLFALSGITDKMSYDGQIGFRERGKNAQKCSSDEQCCPAVNGLDSAMSKCLLVGRCSVYLSIGWTVQCPIVHRMGSALSNCRSDRQ